MLNSGSVTIFTAINPVFFDRESTHTYVVGHKEIWKNWERLGTASSEGTSRIYPALDTRAAPSLILCVLAGFSSCKEEQLHLPSVLFLVHSLFSQGRSGKEIFDYEVLDCREPWCGFLGATLTKTGEWNWNEKNLLRPCVSVLLRHQAPVGMRRIPAGCWWDKTVLAKGELQALASAWMRFRQRGGEGEMMW